MCGLSLWFMVIHRDLLFFLTAYMYEVIFIVWDNPANRLAGNPPEPPNGALLPHSLARRRSIWDPRRIGFRRVRGRAHGFFETFFNLNYLDKNQWWLESYSRIYAIEFYEYSKPVFDKWIDRADIILQKESPKISL